jgi:glycerol-3-phosphate dehydrogenase (NAD(P)+)
VPLHEGLRATSVIERALDGAELVVYAAPSHVLRAGGGAGGAFIARPASPLVVATKGIERERLALMTDVVAEEIAGHPVVALSGPSFAAGGRAHLPTAIVAASERAGRRRAARSRRSATPAFRVYTQRDVTGVELGGALKNVMAVATGISDGLNSASIPGRRSSRAGWPR